MPHYHTLPHNRRILTATMYGHFVVYESLNSALAFLLWFTRSWKSDFCVSFFAVAYFKNTTPSGCCTPSYHTWSDIVTGSKVYSVAAAHLWRPFIYRTYLGDERFRNQNNKSVFPFWIVRTKYGSGTAGVTVVRLWLLYANISYLE